MTDLIIYTAAALTALVFFAGVYFRLKRGYNSVKRTTVKTDVTPFEIDQQLLAYIRRNGGA